MDADVAIVGGGPAGLSAALVLARARRRVVVFDDGRPRNARARAVHGLLGREGMAPAELLRLSREQVEAFPTARIERSRIVDAAREETGFRLVDDHGREHRARRLVLATGVRDLLPPIEGLEPLYGTSVFHCPYCDGWESRDRPIAVWGWSDACGGELALELTQWSRDVVLLTGGSPAFSPELRARLGRHGVGVRGERIARVEGHRGQLARVVFSEGPPLAREVLFFYTRRQQASDLADRLGCEACAQDGCRVEPSGRTNVAGCYIVGDASKDVLQVSVAIADGVKAAVAINRELLDEDLR